MPQANEKIMTRFGKKMQFKFGAMVMLWLSAVIGLPQESQVSSTEYGYPNIQGYWTNPFQTPLERPTNLGNKRNNTAIEAQA